MRIHFISYDGNEIDFPYTGDGAMKFISQQLGCRLGLDTVNLRDGRVMLVDDTGFIDGRPINPKATAIYHSLCKPGTTHPICGPVAIVRDADFA